MVLEISGNKDGEPCSLKDLLVEMEEAGIIDVTINGHSAERTAAKDDAGGFAT